MPTNQSWFKAERIPLRVHALHDFARIDTHAVEDHGKLVHEGNIDIALGVLHYLNCFSCFDRGDRIGACLYHDVVHAFDFFKGLIIHARNDFSDSGQGMDFVPGVDSLRTVTHFEINAAPQSGFPLKDRNAYVLRDPRIDGRFENHDRTPFKVTAKHGRRPNNRRQIGGLVLIDRSRNSNYMKTRFP